MNQYDHYIALDWSINNMAVARITGQTLKPEVIDVPTDIRELKLYLERLKGRKILCVEESTPAQWLYTELKPYVDDLIVCDPYRNNLLKDGGKTDKLDAIRLVQLLKAGLLKPVFHTDDSLINLRRLVSGYDQTIRAGVRFKNQHTAVLHYSGYGREDELPETDREGRFLTEGFQRGIEWYELERHRYEKEFKRLIRELKPLRDLQSIPGIGVIGAVKILASVVDPKRFPTRSRWLSYCGLIRHELISGGRSYGRRMPRYNRALKAVFKTAALSAIGEHRSFYVTEKETKSQPFKRYYQYLIEEKNYPPHQARHAVARRIAVLALGVLRSKRSLEDRWRKKDAIVNQVQTLSV